MDKDPNQLAREAMRQSKPARFYERVQIVVEPNGTHRVMLDEHVLKSPKKNNVLLHDADVAHLIAKEWEAQRTHINLATMHITRLIYGWLDSQPDHALKLRAQIVEYIETDAILYWAESGTELAAMQQEKWQPVLDQLSGFLRHEPIIVAGILFRKQPEDYVSAMMQHLACFDGYALCALARMTAMCHSASLPLLVAVDLLSADAAWQAGRLEAMFNESHWGIDPSQSASTQAAFEEFAALSKIITRRGADGLS